MRLEQLRHGEDRADAHFVRVAARNRDAAIDSERVKVALTRELGLHKYAGARAIRQLRGVAGGDERARLLQAAPIRKHRLQRGKAGERGVGANALVVFQRDGFVGNRAGRLVRHLHHARQRRDLSVEPACGLRGRRPRLRLQAVFVLPFARDLVALSDNLRRLEHRHVEVVTMLDDPGIRARDSGSFFHSGRARSTRVRRRPSRSFRPR